MPEVTLLLFSEVNTLDMYQINFFLNRESLKEKKQ